LVAGYLERLGFTIVERNVRVGRLELDIIARRRNLAVFCEVRARSHDRLMSPAHSIDAGKVKRVRQAAAQWLRSAGLGAVEVRFDAAAVVFDGPEPRIEYYEGAF
jgi:putative endonuclease